MQAFIFVLAVHFTPQSQPMMKCSWPGWCASADGGSCLVRNGTKWTDVMLGFLWDLYEGMFTGRHEYGAGIAVPGVRWLQVGVLWCTLVRFNMIILLNVTVLFPSASCQCCECGCAEICHWREFLCRLKRTAWLWKWWRLGKSDR